MRLIDADALLELVQFRTPIENQTTEIIAMCVEITRDIIADAPTIAAVEVVRCKDCRFRGTDFCAMSLDGEHWEHDFDFCSYGEEGIG